MDTRGEKSYVWLLAGGAVLALIVVSLLVWMLKSESSSGSKSAESADSRGKDKDRDDDKKDKKKKDKKDSDQGQEPKQWTGEDMHESSGVASVPGTDQFLFVDDKDNKNIYCATISDAGEQTGELITVPLGVTVEDAEDITFDGTYFYVVGSQYRKKSNTGAGLIRFKYDANSHTASGVESVADLSARLIKGVPELSGAQGQMRTEDAINIEGLGWDPANKRLLLGLRNPLIDGQALLVPVVLKDPSAALSADNMSFGAAIKLGLEGFAIRSIAYDAGAGHFILIAGATEGEKSDGFVLWSWDGSGAPAKLMELDKKIKPEGVTSVDRNGKRSILVVGDAGYYLSLAEPGQ
jgi:hypothetical protein